MHQYELADPVEFVFLCIRRFSFINDLILGFFTHAKIGGDFRIQAIMQQHAVEGRKI